MADSLREAVTGEQPAYIHAQHPRGGGGRGEPPLSSAAAAGITTAQVCSSSHPCDEYLHPPNVPLEAYFNVLRLCDAERPHEAMKQPPDRNVIKIYKVHLVTKPGANISGYLFSD